jgi:hypothetical protein
MDEIESTSPGPADLIVCQLPGGSKVETTAEACQASGGTILGPLTTDQASPRDDPMVLCNIPGEGTIVTTASSCLANGGTIVSR